MAMTVNATLLTPMFSNADMILLAGVWFSYGEFHAKDRMEAPRPKVPLNDLPLKIVCCKTE